jgi:hypothetical protein
VSNINIPVQALEKIASFMERVPEMVSAISSVPSKEASAPVNRKEAEARAADLVKHAGLDPSRQAEFASFILTSEGALRTIGSLTSKVASLQAEVSQARNLAVGGPASVSKSAAVPGSQASSAWCEALLG